MERRWKSTKRLDGEEMEKGLESLDDIEGGLI